MLDTSSCVKNGQVLKPTLPFSSISKLLENHAKHFGNKNALIFIDVDTDKKETYSYNDLLKKVQCLVDIFSNDYNLKKGDKIALHLGNTPLLLFSHFAAWTIGAITVPLDLKRDTDDKKVFKISSTKVKLILGSSSDKNNFQGLMPEVDFLTDSEIEKHQKTQDLPSNDLSDPSLILFTSGTTANPKGVALTSRNIFLNADGIIDWLKITSSDIFYIVLPLHHINSTTMSMATILAGGTIVLSSRYTKTHFFQAIAENSCSLSSIVPTICLDLLSEEEQFKLHRSSLAQLSRIQIGSAPVVPSDVEKFHQLYQVPLVQGYGSTETALRVAGVSPWGLSDITFQELVAKNSIGGELKWNNLSIHDRDGKEARESEEGELCVRGPILTLGYLNDKNSTQHAFYEGWFHTGDLGYWKNINNKKQYFINGRAKEIIIKGGINISPLSIEDAILKSFPLVKTCYVVGAPDRRLGEEIAVVIVTKDTITDRAAQQLKKDIQNNTESLSSYEKPRYVFIVKEHALPKTSTGKVQRVTIRSYVQHLLTPIFEDETSIIRQLTPFDEELLKTGLLIHNARWGNGLTIDNATLEEATAEGVVIGIINKQSNKLEGILFALKAKSDDIISLSEKYKTYDKATHNLTLKSNEPDGDSLLLVSVATNGEPFHVTAPENKDVLEKIAKDIIPIYLPHDPVISFHMKPKAGLARGASVLHIIPKGREADIASLGYSVIMQYDALRQEPVVNPRSPLGIQLLEASFLYGYRHSIKKIFAYSRPAGLLSYLLKKTST